MMKHTLMARVAVVLLSVLSLSACGTWTDAITARVPTSGPIEQGDQVTSSQADQFIRVIARPPSPGMTATQIVQGFLDASASFDGDHAVARSYLTEEASRSWNPNAGVQVYEGSPSLTETGRLVTMTGTQAGTISAIGRFDIADPGTELRERFSVVRVDGEIRISRVPPGLVLSNADVDRAFRSYAVYFFNPAFSTLVPDARLIPVIGPALATTLVRRLVDGPNDWLRPAVRTGFPDGVTLTLDSVPIDAGVATVDLTAAVRLADDRALQALSQQLVWTLRQLPEVTSVLITSEGVPVSVPGAPTPQPRDAWPLVDPSGVQPPVYGYVATPLGVRRLLSEGSVAVPGGAGVAATPLQGITISREEERVAGFDEEGELFIADLSVTGRLQGGESYPLGTRAVFDGSSTVWLAGPEVGLLARATNGRTFGIDVEGVTGNADRTVITVVPSRDGTRAALIVREGPRTTLYLARVERTAVTGVTGIRVSGLIRVENRLAEVVDVAWAGADVLSVLAGESAGSLQVYEVALARGSVLAQGGPVAPVSLAAAPGQPTLVAAADGVIYDNTSGVWIGRANASSPAYPQ